MRENIQQNLTLKELASYFKYSPSHFSALFFGETGVSPMNYFIRLKIQKACEYIELTNMKLNEIATHLGFEDAAYFSRTFTKVMVALLPFIVKRRWRSRLFHLSLDKGT